MMTRVQWLILQVWMATYIADIRAIRIAVERERLLYGPLLGTCTSAAIAIAWPSDNTVT